MRTGESLLGPLWDGWWTNSGVHAGFFSFHCNTLPHITVTHFHKIRFTTADHSWQVTCDIFKPCASQRTLIQDLERGTVGRLVPEFEPCGRRYIEMCINMQGSCNTAALCNPVSPSRCKQKSDTEAVVTALFSSMRRYILKLSLFWTVFLCFLLAVNAFPPPCCSDIALVFCVCIGVCRWMCSVISIHGTQILFSFTYFPSHLALRSWLTSLSVQWSSGNLGVVQSWTHLHDSRLHVTLYYCVRSLPVWKESKVNVRGWYTHI